jgi:hypothetical protein
VRWCRPVVNTTSVKDETEYLRKLLTDRVQRMDLAQLKRLQDFVTGVIDARHEETPLKSLLDDLAREDDDQPEN